MKSPFESWNNFKLTVFSQSLQNYFLPTNLYFLNDEVRAGSPKLGTHILTFYLDNLLIIQLTIFLTIFFLFRDGERSAMWLFLSKQSTITIIRTGTRRPVSLLWKMQRTMMILRMNLPWRMESSASRSMRRSSKSLCTFCCILFFHSSVCNSVNISVHLSIWKSFFISIHLKSQNSIIILPK